MGSKSRFKKKNYAAREAGPVTPARKSFAKHALMPLAFAAAMGLLPWETSQNANRAPTSKQLAPEKNYEGQDLRNLGHIFSGGPMSYEAASKEIERVTGIRPRNVSFSVPDSHGLTKTPRFYSFDLAPAFFPVMREGKIVIGKTKDVGVAIFNTYMDNKDDGRIAALAHYILSKSNCKTEKEAVSAVAWWITKNLHWDFEHDDYSGLPNSSQRGRGETKQHANSILILRHGGVCVDFVNLAVDLLNSVGIPSRSISVGVSGLAKGVQFLENTNSIAGVLVIGHALLEVSLPSEIFYSDIPSRIVPSAPNILRSPGVLTISPGAFLSERFRHSFPDARLTKISAVGAIPESSLAPFPLITRVVSGLDINNKDDKTKEMMGILFSADFDKEYGALLDDLGSYYILTHKDYFFERFAAASRSGASQ